ncbi:cupin domain-containing protein [Patescibacteria group bacterium]
MEKEIIQKAIDEIDGRSWHPVEIPNQDGDEVHLALFDGEYHWHMHPDYDELFEVISGKIIIQVKNEVDIILNQGESTIIPKGVEHCPKSVVPSYVLMTEKR